MSITGTTSISVLFLLMCLCWCNEARESIMLGEELKEGEFLVSAGGLFELGFFHLGTSNSYYLGSWFKDQQRLNQFLETKLNPRPLWIGNRDTPISGSAGVLTIDSNGTLKIVYGESLSIIISSYHAATNVTATILDSGNFVLTGLISNGTGESRVLWQSFDHPTDVLLPGMKLGMSTNIGENWSLTSWLTEDVPASGAFSLNVDDEGQLVARQRGEIYWTSGSWNGENFEDIPIAKIDLRNYGCSYVWTKNNYFSCPEKKTSSDASALWILSFVGILGTYQMNGVDSNSHRFATLESCAKSMGQFELSKEKMVATNVNVELNKSDPDTSLGQADCLRYCQQSCSCIAYAVIYNNGTGCTYYPTGTKFKTSSNGSNIYILSSQHGKKSLVWLWVVVSLGSVLTLAFMACLCWKLNMNRGDKKIGQVNTSLELGRPADKKLSHDNLLQDHGRKCQDLPVFDFYSIESATCSFSYVNILGKGGFGPVYKGVLKDGQEIAIKRLSKSSGQGLQEFKNEIVLIAKLQHTNLVRLLGYCIQGEEKMLIYEYMPNKSLDLTLFDQTKKTQLDWKMRTNIIEGIAQGLLYLHKYSRLRVIHRDLKASNILLDQEMNPKISDFGMARIFGKNDSEASTNRIVGTYGYMSPEYAMEGLFSVKSDVFSFGVLLLEILSGRKNTGFTYLDRHSNLIGHAWEAWKKGDIAEVLDPVISNVCPLEIFSKFIHIGILCVQESAKDRPTMSDVVFMLNNETTHLPVPKQPVFNMLRDKAEGEGDIFKVQADISCFSNSGLTISHIQGR